MERMRGRERCLQLAFYIYMHASLPCACKHSVEEKKKRGEKSLKQPSLVVGEEEE